MITLRSSQRDEIVEQARAAAPAECCGLIGGDDTGRALTVYQLKNVAENPHLAYEAAPEELFTAQKQMRERGEHLLAIYHSHPRSMEPQPSETDIRLAYYPSATYFIVGLGGPSYALRAFRISERKQEWQSVEYAIAD